MSMPSFVALQSNYNKKYLHFLNENEKAHGFLKSSGEKVVSPYTKYKVEQAKNGLVHIRSCYNNKYWVRWSPTHHWIIAGANEPDDDQSKWSCTLFDPQYIIGVGGAPTLVRFLHVQLKHYVCVSKAAPPYDSCLYAGSASHDKDQSDVFTYIDLESLFVLPKHVAFKGDNNLYLMAREFDNPVIDGRLIDGKHVYLQFSSPKREPPTVRNDVFITSDGRIKIKNYSFQKFWLRHFNNNYIEVDGDESNHTSNNNALFWPRKEINCLKHNNEMLLALRNCGNNNFCHRAPESMDLLKASSTAVKWMMVDELVTTRNIDDVKYCLRDARIYNKSVVPVGKEVVINDTNEAKNVDVKILYKSKSRSWNSSISMKLFDITHLDAFVPVIIKDDKVVILGERFIGEYKWGETITTATTKEETIGHKVTLAPKTKVTVTLVATQASCDVPFSYTQHDTLVNGKVPDTEVISDGVYTGTNCYDYRYEPIVEKL